MLSVIEWLIIDHYATAMIVVLVIGCLGNVVVLLASLTQASSLRRQQKVVNIYVGHLAVADLLHLSSIVPLVRMTQVNTWTWGLGLCRLYYTVHYLGWTASTYVITVMGFDRFVAMATPTLSKSLRGPAFAKAIKLGLWLTSGLLVCPIGLYATVTSWDWEETNRTTYSCGHFSEDVPADASGHWTEGLNKLVNDPGNFSKYTFVTGFLIPLLLVLTFYTVITYKLYQQSRDTTANSVQARRRFLKVSGLVTSLIVCFVLFTLPHWLHVVLGFFGIIPAAWLPISSHLTTFLSYMSNVCNPILYACLNAAFRQNLIKILTCNRALAC